jgi:peptidoglycan/xylan/chitin deacetylase (PgdA/CDA1 family)
MKYIKYLVFALLHFLGISALYRLCTPWRARILCYHRISESPRDPLLDVSEKKFEEHVKYLTRCYAPMHLSDIVELLCEKKTPQRLSCALSFDDGSEDWLTRALPVLKRHNVPATFFTTTGFIGNGLIPYPRPHAPARALTLQEFTALAASSLAAIGGHTVTHPHLSRLSEPEMREEIKTSKRTLELWTGKLVHLYAYPFGNEADYNETTKRVTREEGFKAGFSIEERTATAADDRYELPRMVIFDEPLWMFKVRVSGIIDDFLYFFKQLIKSK